MNPQSLMGSIAWPADHLLLASGVVVIVGIVLVNFWKEILVGLLAITLVAHFFAGKEDPADTPVNELKTQETIADEPMQAAGPETSEYLEDCMSLTQNRSLCTEIWAQFSVSSLSPLRVQISE